MPSERVLILAPFGRDSSLLREKLVAANLQAEVCGSVKDVTGAMHTGAGTALIGDEALREEGVKSLKEELVQQPPWSDFPIIVMTSGGNTTDGSRYRLRLLEPLGNLTLLERPLRTETLLSSLQVALRARRHQYQLAAYFEERRITEQEITCRNEELTNANRELEEFAYVASHDLQEPLRMINIYTQLLLRDFAGGNNSAQRYADVIHKGVNRMERLLQDILSFSRTIHLDGLIVEKADLSRSLSQALSTLSSQIEENTATIQFNHLPTVEGDEAQLAHVFQNLLSNALKYRKVETPPQITIGAELQGTEWVVSVTDNGIGFEQRYAQRIFGLFKRLHKDEYPGTGLGLAICQRIIERCGGRMWAEGRPGEGATFYLSLQSVEL